MPLARLISSLMLAAVFVLVHADVAFAAEEGASGSAGKEAEKSAMPPPPYKSERRAECETELKRDAGWRADLRDRLRKEVRVEDADEFLRNKRHVVIAYAAIWILTVGFLVVLWRRQRGLAAEIERLQGDLQRAVDETSEKG